MKNTAWMPTALVLAVACAACAGEAPAVKLTQEAAAIKVEIGGQPFTTYHFAEGLGAPFVRPFFYPVLAADGTEVTADQVQTKGDHPHHRSLWVAHGSVNGVDHWGGKTEDSPKQRHVGFTKVAGDTIVEQLEWEGKTHEPILKETRTCRFFAYATGERGVDLTSVYEPVSGKVTFGDTKEAGLCSVRVVKALADTSVVTQSTGAKDEAPAKGEPNTWGKKAAWCDLSGTIGGKPYGVAVLDHPGNPRHPGNWHVRRYGLLSANIFGLSEYSKANAKGSGALTLEQGKPVTFRYRVVIHAGDAKSADLDTKFKEYAELK
ncbi:MAG: PmoA family protein [Planctomycetota bacterium]|nr:PmoA family protein [Planctomycetota bacterium]